MQLSGLKVSRFLDKKNSVQSIMDLVLGKCLKYLVRLVVICSRVGQEIKKINSRQMNALRIYHYSTSTSKPLLIFGKVSTNSSLMEIFRFGPTL